MRNTCLQIMGSKGYSNNVLTRDLELLVGALVGLSLPSVLTKRREPVCLEVVKWCFP